MKKISVAVVFLYAVLLTFAIPCWAQANKISGIIGLDAALDGAVKEIEAKLPKGTPIVVTAITAPSKDTMEFLGDELSGRFKNLKTLAREAALREVEKEQDFQLSGMVSDDSAVGIGHFIGAQFVISGDMKQFADFTQLRLRIVDVRTAETFTYSARINNKDRLLTNIIPPAVTAASGSKPVKVSENVLDHLNRGYDFIVQKKFDEALQEFNQAIAINSNMAEAYKSRGWIYFLIGEKNGRIDDIDRSIADYTSAIRINPNYAEAYFMRGYIYERLKKDFDRAIADYTSALRINPNYVDVYRFRADAYERNGDYDRAIADYTNTIRINPKYVIAYSSRAAAYHRKRDYDRAIADYTSIIRIDSNDKYAYSGRGYAYEMKNDYDNVIADFTSAIRIDPNDADYYNTRGEAYENKGDIDRAIADYENALRLGNSWLKDKIERLRKQRGK